MHQIVQDNLEEYLAGALESESQESVETHLATCPECREQVSLMKEQSLLFEVMRSEEEVAVPAGFYARLAGRIEAEPVSVWSLLFQPAFARRVAFASLMLLAVLGSLLVSQESEYASVPTPEVIMAVDQEHSAITPGQPQTRDHMLYTLVSYQQQQ